MASSSVYLYPAQDEVKKGSWIWKFESDDIVADVVDLTEKYKTFTVKFYLTLLSWSRPELAIVEKIKINRIIILPHFSSPRDPLSPEKFIVSPINFGDRWQFVWSYSGNISEIETYFPRVGDAAASRQTSESLAIADIHLEQSMVTAIRTSFDVDVDSNANYITITFNS